MKNVLTSCLAAVVLCCCIFTIPEVHSPQIESITVIMEDVCDDCGQRGPSLPPKLRPRG